MLITPDFNEIPEGAGGAIPAGVYKVRIAGVEPKTSKAGNAYLKYKMTIFGAEGEASRYNNWPVFTNVMTSGKGALRLKQLLDACDVKPGPFEAESLVGKEVQATLTAGKNADGTDSTWPDVKAFRKL